MKDKNIKKALNRYVETQAEQMSSDVTEPYELSALDQRVLTTIESSTPKPKNQITWSMRRISALAVSFILVVGLCITAVFMLNKEPYQSAADAGYSVIISYQNEQYGYFSNRVVIDKYEVCDVSELKASPELFTDTLGYNDIVTLDSVISRESIAGAKIYPHSNEVIILVKDGHYYYFEKVPKTE